MANGNARKGKKCWDCKTWKPFTSFYRNRSYKNGHQKRCKKCAKIYDKWWRSTKHGKERTHVAQIKYRFGLDEARYKALLEEQNGKCAICGKRPRRRLSVDHVHGSSKVRGLLCGNCNLAIGLFDENLYSLQKAVSYLGYYERNTTIG